VKEWLLKPFKDINFIAIIIIALAYNSIINRADEDFWGRLYCGASYLLNQGVLYQDIFAFTTTKSIWVDHEWLSSIIFFLIFKYAGSTGILILKWVFITTLIGLIYFASRLRLDGKKNILFLLLVLLAIEPGVVSNIRVHNFTYIFFAFWLLILEFSRQKDNYKYLWILPVSFVLWVNLHAGCVAGLALVAIYAISNFLQKKDLKPYLYVFFSGLFLILLNPYGYHYYGYILDELTSKHDAITEWEPIRLFDINHFKFFKLLLITTVFAFIFSKRSKSDPVPLLLLISLGYFSLGSVRHTILFSIVAGVFVYEHLSDVYQRIVKLITSHWSSSALNKLDFAVNKGLAFFLILLFVPTLIRLNILTWQIEAPLSSYPVYAVSFMKNNDLKGDVLLPFKWGQYVTWRLFPDVQVSIDGRHAQVYPQKVFNLNNDFYFARPGWQRILKQFNPDILLVDKAESPVYKELKKMDEWISVYEDQYTSIMLPQNDPRIGILSEIKRVQPGNIDNYDSWFTGKINKNYVKIYSSTVK
jgi:hypothetical protein